MAVEIYKFAVEYGDNLINSVRKQEASVEYRDFSLGFGDVVSVEIDSAHKRALLEASAIVNIHMVIPANAGIHEPTLTAYHRCIIGGIEVRLWISAFAGMTMCAE
jgi:hypothetical protein